MRGPEPLQAGAISDCYSQRLFSSKNKFQCCIRPTVEQQVTLDLVNWGYFFLIMISTLSVACRH